MVRSLYILIGAALLATAASAQDVVLGGRRCATPEPTIAQTLESIRAVERMAARVGDLRAEVRLAGPITVPVAWHVVTGSNGVGDVPDAWIEAQLDTLNSTYTPFGYRFVSALIERVENPAWYDGLRLGSAAEDAMKAALASDPAHYLNMYTASLGLDYLGWATPPDGSAERDTYQGVVLLDQSLPGGNAAPYNLGHTGTHEVGHWFGLLHTFSGGCNQPNDGVADTPQERSSASGCPAARDSCPLDPGLDPVHNYMDYSDDACMTEFTPGQVARALALTAQYRPTITAGGFGLATVPRGAFDGLLVGVTATAELRVTNATEAAFTVTDVTGAGAFAISGLPATVPAGGVTVLPLEVTPDASGDFSTTLGVVTDSPDAGTIDLAVSGSATLPPTARLQRTEVSASLIESEAAAFEVLLSNDGDGPLMFAIDETTLPAWATAASPLTGTIPPHRDTTLTIALDADDLDEATYTDVLVIETNDPLREEVTVGLTLAVRARPARLAIGSIRPNPSAGRVRIVIETPQPTRFATVEIFDTQGRLMAELSRRSDLALGYPEFEWDASSVPAGVYVVRVTTPYDGMATGRIVIAR